MTNFNDFKKSYTAMQSIISIISILIPILVFAVLAWNNYSIVSLPGVWKWLVWIVLYLYFLVVEWVYRKNGMWPDEKKTSRKLKIKSLILAVIPIIIVVIFFQHGYIFNTASILVKCMIVILFILYAVFAHKVMSSK